MLGLAEVERRQIDLRPVAFPPGLLKLRDQPSGDRIKPTTKTIGTDVVATLAASAAGGEPATIIDTGRRANSPPNASCAGN
jgi:hypothetical protein